MSFFNEKAQKWVEGRKGLMDQICQQFQTQTAPIIWMHCASMGEFEQGRPLLVAIKQQHPNYQVFLSFFSPSGYEVCKNYEGANYVSYLPMDGAKNAKRFFDAVKPSLIIFVKYEFWHYYSIEANKRNIPILLVSGIFRKEQLFFQWYGNFYRNILHQFSYLFVQDLGSAKLLEGIGLANKTTVCGDTRFDRVISIAEAHEPIDLVADFCKDHQTIIAGSTWSEDDAELNHFINTHPTLRCIVAPHEIIPERLNQCLKCYHHSMLYSDYEMAINEQLPLANDLQVLIINNYGMLTKLYQYAHICLVGGGFGGDGVHNVLEAAVYGKPVVIGPVYDKYLEAEELVNNGGCISVENALELEEVLNELLDDSNDTYRIAAEMAKTYVYQKAGATKSILDHIEAKRLLTN